MLPFVRGKIFPAHLCSVWQGPEHSSRPSWCRPASLDLHRSLRSLPPMEVCPSAGPSQPLHGWGPCSPGLRPTGDSGVNTRLSGDLGVPVQPCVMAPLLSFGGRLAALALVAHARLLSLSKKVVEWSVHPWRHQTRLQAELGPCSSFAWSFPSPWLHLQGSPPASAARGWCC